MKQHYRVTSKFRDKTGRELFERETFEGVDDDARCALAEAFEKMSSIVAADPRVDMVSSTVKGADGSIVTSADYADEIGSGESMSGLTEEIHTYAPTRAEEHAFEQAASDILMDGQDRPFGEGTEEKEVPYEEGIFPGPPIRGEDGRADIPRRAYHLYKDIDGPLDHIECDALNGRDGKCRDVAGKGGDLDVVGEISYPPNPKKLNITFPEPQSWAEARKAFNHIKGVIK